MHFLGANKILPKTSRAAWWQDISRSLFHRKVKNLRLPFDSNRNIFTIESHKNACTFFRCVQIHHFLHEVMLPGGKMYQADFAIFSSKEVKLHDLLVCFIATSNV